MIIDQKRRAFFLFGYIVAAIILLLYSFTQIDLNLTLSGSGIVQSMQRSFQFIGFYKRPFSTGIFLIQIFIWFALYVYTLLLTYTKKIQKPDLFKVIIAVSFILLWSYPAFSYDIFNYMFTAKTVLVYRKNPYIVIPQQFMSIEPLVQVMRWIHLPSAYTPLWIGMTLPAYLFGFDVFLLTLWNIKFIAVFSYFAAVYFLEKILAIIEPKLSLFGTAVFALNPLILFETHVSGHNDMFMMALMLMSIYYALKNKKLLAFFLFSLSVAAKLMTIFLFPVMLYALLEKEKNNKFFYSRQSRVIVFICMSIGFFLVLTRREVLPWYFVWMLSVSALLPSSKKLITIMTAASIGLLLRYAPYLYFGHWDPPVGVIKQYVTFVPLFVSIAVISGYWLVKKSRSRGF